MLIQKINVGLIHHAGSLHGISQIGRLGEFARSIQTLSGKKQNDLVRVVGVSKEMFLFQTGGGTSGRVLIIDRFPTIPISDFMTN
jgi:hypothetical protein